METIRLADLDHHSISNSPLDDRLLQLSSDSESSSRRATESVIEQSPVASAKAGDSKEFASWTDRFDANREQITRRLALIEAELNRQERPDASPKLGVYGSH